MAIRRRKMFPALGKRRSPKVEIIPMVDVMFLLLVFYILSSLALHKQRGIAVDLPQAQSGVAAAEKDEMVLSIISVARQASASESKFYQGLSRLGRDRSWPVAC